MAVQSPRRQHHRAQSRGTRRDLDRWLQPDSRLTALCRGRRQQHSRLRYRSLGPRDDNGKLIGGRYLSVGSVEISRRVLPTWRIAAFVDGGSAFNEKHDKFYQSAGLGVRWLSPVGQVRVDVAMPIQDRENSGFKLHISMGPPL
ncbi:MAG: BamA/TamA family outer membrane protein [Gammaproteobacteria bacterium]|nr:BamA/TamA family outer membrane protein [Gammaproteobacteria bacterium]